MAHPAAEAWKRLDRTAHGPVRVEVLKERPRASAYRLVGAGPRNGTIIAKHCRGEIAALERRLYDDLLPRLGSGAPRCFGQVEASAGSSWLFVEDAGTEEETGLREEHARLLAEWLASFHIAAAGSRLQGSLPGRDTRYYRSRLESTQESIRRSWSSPALQSDDRGILRDILVCCERLACRWDRVERACAPWPETLVHGDLVGKNLRVRAGRNGPALLAFDWEEAGWGVPLIDLVEFKLGRARAGLGAYGFEVQRAWPRIREEDCRSMAEWGALLWILTVLCGESRGLADGGTARAMRKFPVYRTWFADALRELGMET